MHLKQSFISLLFFTLLVKATRAEGPGVNAHGCLMVTAWMFFASVAIVMARYFREFFGSDSIWFQIHRAFMIIVPILSTIAFIVILSELEWEWVENDEPLPFAHSILGVTAISLSVIQVIMGLLRPGLDSDIRPIFNYVHRFTGLLTFFLASVFLEDLVLGNSAWAVFTAWTIWIFLLAVTLELLSFLDIDKTVIFFLHVLVAFGLTLTMIVLIGTAKLDD